MNRITPQMIREWGACWSDREIAEYFAGRESLSPREIANDETISHLDRLWVLTNALARHTSNHWAGFDLAMWCTEQALLEVDHRDTMIEALVGSVSALRDCSDLDLIGRVEQALNDAILWRNSQPTVVQWVLVCARQNAIIAVVTAKHGNAHAYMIAEACRRAAIVVDEDAALVQAVKLLEAV